MAQISLPKKPFDVAIRGSSYPFTSQGWLFLAITHRIRLVAFHTMIAKYQFPRRDSLGASGKRVDSGMVLGGNMIPSITSGRSPNRSRAYSQQQYQGQLSHQRPPCCALLLFACP